MTRPTAAGDVLAEMTRVQALFQARTIAAHLGAPMPRLEDFRHYQTPARHSGFDRAGGPEKADLRLVRQRGGAGARAIQCSAKVSNGAPHSPAPETTR